MSSNDTGENESGLLSDSDKVNINSSLAGEANIPVNGDWVSASQCPEYRKVACGRNTDFPEKGHFQESTLCRFAQCE